MKKGLKNIFFLGVRNFEICSDKNMNHIFYADRDINNISHQSTIFQPRAFSLQFMAILPIFVEF